MDNTTTNGGEPSRFPYQQNQFFGECLPCTATVFNEQVDSPQVEWKIMTRRAVEQSITEERPLDEFVQSATFQKFCQKEERKEKTGSHFLQLAVEQKLRQWTNSLKESLFCLIFGVAGFEEVMVTGKDGTEHPFHRRKQEGIMALSGLIMFDGDHLPIPPEELFKRTQVEGFPWRIVLAHKTSSGHGLRLVAEARPEIGNIADNQIQLALDLGIFDMMGTTGKPVVDDSCIDASRISYCPCRKDIFFMDEQALFAEQKPREDGYLNDFDKKFREDYRQGKTQPTNPTLSFKSAVVATKPSATVVAASSSKLIAHPSATDSAESQQAATTPKAKAEKFGHSLLDYVQVLLPNGAPVGSRHDWTLKVFTDLLILCDNNDTLAREVIESLPWVQDIIRERGVQELDNIVDSSKKRNKKRESENLYPLQPSLAMRRAIEEVCKRKYSELVKDEHQKAMNLTTTGYHDDETLMLERMGKEIKKLIPFFPMLKLACHNMKPRQYVAAMFLIGAYGMTLMTRCWYRFWSEPNRRCRLNTILEIIGRSGSGKHIAVDFYELMMQPIKDADKVQIDALNKWNQEREQKGGADKNKTARPKGILRCMPSEASSAAIREAEFNAKEEIDGEEMALHVFMFNSELDQLLRNQKVSYMNIDALFLKSLHNEPAGAFLKTASSNVGEYNVHFNGVFTGTSDALNKQTTTENFARGLLQRLVTIPIGDSCYEMREYREYTEKDRLRDEQLRQWAYNLNKTKGEIPCVALSKALHDWTKNQMDDAKEEDSKALEDLVKRPCWHAINNALPFIVARHWGEMVEDSDGRMKCGPSFSIDKQDIKLTLLMANAQMAFQKHFFLPIGEEFYNNQLIAAASNYQPTQRLKLAYGRLPDIFTSADVASLYGYDNKSSVNSRLKRLQDEGLAQRIRSGVDKGKYRKLVVKA